MMQEELEVLHNRTDEIIKRTGSRRFSNIPTHLLIPFLRLQRHSEAETFTDRAVANFRLAGARTLERTRINQ